MLVTMKKSKRDQPSTSKPCVESAESWGALVEGYLPAVKAGRQIAFRGPRSKTEAAQCLIAQLSVKILNKKREKTDE